MIDGFVTDYKVAQVPLARDGTFSASIPDLYHDPLTGAAGQGVHALIFFAQIRQGGRTRTLTLAPKANDHAVGADTGLNIRKSYDNPVVFTVRN
jgi:hypothetical protein